MPKVYIINNMTHDFDKAARYGDLVNVTEGKVPIFKTDVIKNMVREGLADFTKHDFLLVSGPTILCMIAFMQANYLTSGDYVQLLVFDAKEQDYVVRHI